MIMNEETMEYDSYQYSFINNNIIIFPLSGLTETRSWDVLRAKFLQIVLFIPVTMTHIKGDVHVLKYSPYYFIYNIIWCYETHNLIDWIILNSTHLKIH